MTNDQLLEWYKSMSRISPNEYIYLLHLHGGHQIKHLFNESISRRILLREKLIDAHGRITREGLIVIGESEPTRDYINEYRELFPRGILPHGRAARSSVQDLKAKFDWFFRTYSYDWDTVLKSTEAYVRFYEEQNFKFMQTASNFISKQDVSRVKSSSLAEWCEKVESDKEQVVNDFDLNI